MNTREILERLLQFKSEDHIVHDNVMNHCIPLDEADEKRWKRHGYMIEHKRFAIEAELTTEEKLRFLDTLTDGKMSAALHTAQKFLEMLPNMRGGEYNLISKEAWKQFAEHHDTRKLFVCPSGWNTDSVLATSAMFDNTEYDNQYGEVKGVFGRVLDEQILDSFVDDAFHHQLESFLRRERWHICDLRNNRTVPTPYGDMPYQRAVDAVLDSKCIRQSLESNGVSLKSGRGEAGETLLIAYETGNETETGKVLDIEETAALIAAEADFSERIDKMLKEDKAGSDFAKAIRSSRKEKEIG